MLFRSPGEYLNSFNDFSNSSLRSGSAEWEPARRHVTFSPGYAMNRHHAAIKDHCTEHRGTPIPIKKHSSAANKTAKNSLFRYLVDSGVGRRLAAVADVRRRSGDASLGLL